MMTLQQRFEEKGLDYQYYYNQVSDSLDPLISSSLAERIIREELEGILMKYTETPAKTKGGKILRFFSGILAKLLPLIKIRKNDTYKS